MAENVTVADTKRSVNALVEEINGDKGTGKGILGVSKETEEQLGMLAAMGKTLDDFSKQIANYNKALEDEEKRTRASNQAIGESRDHILGFAARSSNNDALLAAAGNQNTALETGENAVIPGIKARATNALAMTAGMTAARGAVEEATKGVGTTNGFRENQLAAGNIAVQNLMAYNQSL